MEIKTGVDVKNERLKRKMSMQDFASACGLSTQTIYNIEHSKHELSELTLSKINSFLK